MKPEHDQQPEDNREPHTADQVRDELLGRPGPPQKHNGGGQKPRVERGDHRQAKTGHTGVRLHVDIGTASNR